MLGSVSKDRAATRPLESTTSPALEYTKASPWVIHSDKSSCTIHLFISNMGCFSSKPDGADPGASAAKMAYVPTPTTVDGVRYSTDLALN
ncbi:hypothetical protein HBH70_077360 [Parastagonospora nodorum]|nr:hypothetical protein HBH53_050930 [Parastagonospora nodorum]KAH4045768.1 hypothetical protein HBH49_195180 [Parastagonospora nodorum]KAH4173695.1 hypothetical protein HBH43_081210 [Parastagonospora nodorum]KAH4305579.1 hypothetical protein HBI01_067700 [Parastagonospora nodorum]KAH4329131.1 hypothetical protein HBI00_098630 [Parastagonospora nodorum]